MADIIKKILISEIEFTKSQYERLKKASVYIKHNLLNSDGNFIVGSLIEINNIITGLIQ